MGRAIALINNVSYPTTDFAVPEYTAAQTPVWSFDDTTDESIDFYMVLTTAYSGGDLKVIVPWTLKTWVTSTTVDWEVSIARIRDDADPITSLTFATAQTVIDTVAGTAGETSHAEITFTASQFDDIAIGDQFCLRLTRDASGGTASGDALAMVPYVENA